MKPCTIDPTTLTLLTTYRCTAACPNCCFNCSPKPLVDEVMSLEKMKGYISSAQKAFPSLKLVVFTGGECTLLGEDLFHAIHYSKSLGLSTRIVSNGHWGRSKDAAKRVIDRLVEVGLDEINFSTGDEHSMFVPLQSLTYAISECAKCACFKTILVNIELLPSHKITETDIMNSTYVRNLDNHSKKKIRCIKSPWIEFRKKTEETHQDTTAITLQRPCRDVLTSINISPSGQFLSCCGFASEYSPFLKLGRVLNNNLKELHYSRFNDLLKLWLFSVGPYQILKEIGCEPQDKNRHGCEYCLHMLQDKTTLNKLLSINPAMVRKIILDYNLIISRHESINKTTHR